MDSEKGGHLHITHVTGGTLPLKTVRDSKRIYEGSRDKEGKKSPKQEENEFYGKKQAKSRRKFEKSSCETYDIMVR